jgi:hypothetical protein
LKAPWIPFRGLESDNVLRTRRWRLAGQPREKPGADPESTVFPGVPLPVLGFIHIQRQLQFAFQKCPAFRADRLGVMLVSLDDDDKIIGKSTGGSGTWE